MCSVSVFSELVCQRSLCQQHTGLGLPALLELASRSARRVAISATPTDKSTRTAQAYKNVGAHSCASNWLDKLYKPYRLTSHVTWRRKRIAPRHGQIKRIPRAPDITTPKVSRDAATCLPLHQSQH